MPGAVVDVLYLGGVQVHGAVEGAASLYLDVLLAPPRYHPAGVAYQGMAVIVRLQFEVQLTRRVIPDVDIALRFTGVEIHLGVPFGDVGGVSQVDIVLILVAGGGHDDFARPGVVVDGGGELVGPVVSSLVSAQAQVDHAGSTQCLGFAEYVVHPGDDAGSVEVGLHHDDVGLGGRSGESARRPAAGRGAPGYVGTVTIGIVLVHAAGERVEGCRDLTLGVLCSEGLTGGKGPPVVFLVPDVQDAGRAVFVDEIVVFEVYARVDSPDDDTGALVSFRQLP